MAAADFVAVSHRCGGLLQRSLQLLVGVLLHCLRILQLLDEFHFQLFHLHDFFLLLRSHVVLVVDAVIMLLLHLSYASLAVLFNLHRGQTLLLVYDLILHAVFLFDLEALELLFLLVLLLDYLGLLGFFAPGLEDSLLHLALLISALLVQRIIIVRHHALLIVLHLVVVDFLQQKQNR